MKKFCIGCNHIGRTIRYNHQTKKSEDGPDHLIACLHPVSEAKAAENQTLSDGATELVRGNPAKKLYIACAMMRLPHWPCGREGKLWEPKEEE